MEGRISTGNDAPISIPIGNFITMENSQLNNMQLLPMLKMENKLEMV